MFKFMEVVKYFFWRFFLARIRSETMMWRENFYWHFFILFWRYKNFIFFFILMYQHKNNKEIIKPTYNIWDMIHNFQTLTYSTRIHDIFFYREVIIGFCKSYIYGLHVYVIHRWESFLTISKKFVVCKTQRNYSSFWAYNRSCSCSSSSPFQCFF